MITAEKYTEIAHGLLEKTRAGKAKWQRHGTDEEQAFRLELPNSKLILRYLSPPTEPDAVVLALCRADGIPVGTWTVDEGEEDWPFAQEFYAEVQRRVLGWDKVLEDIERYLKSN